VLVTDGFVAVTGYPRQEIVGRNCRFLQGPGTSPQAVQRIRDGLNSGEGCTELLLNYREFLLFVRMRLLTLNRSQRGAFLLCK
jgi:hypothetical protein